MKLFEVTLSRLNSFLLLAMCLIFWFGHVHADEETEVYVWVANEMDIGSVPSMPYIHFVDKESLQSAFKANNQASVNRWKANYGEARALQIMSRYLQSLIGIFIAKSETILIDRYLPPCRRRAALAHEFSHFFQYFTKGAISPDQYDSDARRMVREMQAEKIEKKYWAEHCSDYEHVCLLIFYAKSFVPVLKIPLNTGFWAPSGFSSRSRKQDWAKQTTCGPRAPDTFQPGRP